jgi:polyisoprenoid-binding protein YceI
MKIIASLLSALLLMVVVAGFAPTEREAASWSIDKVHSNIGFKVKHLGISKVRGDFEDYEVTLNFDPEDLSTLETEVTVQIASIDTENDRRDNHLRSDDFFNAESHPTMTFVSKEVRNIDGNEFEIVGDLTIRGTTKEVVLDAEFLGTAAMGEQERSAFEARTTINRMDYGLAWNNLTEAGGFVVGHDVDIIIELEAIKN